MSARPRPILALHIRASGNIGDRWSCPADYVEFPGHEVVFRDVKDFLRNPGTVRPRFVIAGGGAWKRDLRRLKGVPLLQGVPKVAWGVGLTYRRMGPMAKRAHLDRAKGWNLYGHRDVGLDGRYVPCASCLHPAFDREYPIEHEAVYYGHGELMPLGFAKGLAPHRTNLGRSMEEALAFLGSGEVVVTSSYHGAYWARLLGRKVALIPRASKFWHLPGPGASLEEHRALNRAFHADVLRLLEAAP